MENQPTTPQTPTSAPLPGQSTDAGQSTYNPTNQVQNPMVTSPMSFDATQSMPPSPTVSQPIMPPKKSGLKKIILLVISLLLIAGAAAAAGYYYMQAQEAQDEITKLKAEKVAAASGLHDLPADAVKVSECVPNMGYHYLAKDADPIYGPFLLVNKSGKVIGVEYMYDQTMLQPIPNLKPPIEVLPKNTPLYNWTYDHGEISRANEGHDGFLLDHYDFHAYTVNTEIRAQACQ